MTTQKASNQHETKLVLGLGQTGLSCVRYFLQLGYEVIAYDTRSNPPNIDEVHSRFPQVKTYTGVIDESVLNGVSELILSPGLSLKTPIVQAAIKRNIPVVGDIEVFARTAKAPVIAVTGSNGKSTTVSMIAAILEQAHNVVRLGGNIGTPALDLLSDKEPDFYVLELSSFQLETTESLRPKVAAILNISEDHMDRYTNLDEYAQAKLKIYKNAEHCIFNLDDVWLRTHVTGGNNCVGFTLSRPEKNQYGFDRETNSMCAGSEVLMPASALKVQGKHQLANALVAFAMADMCGVPRQSVRNTLATFEGLPHRTQFVAEKDGILYINDSKGTNVGATQAAIDGFDQPIILIAGGIGKGADFTALRSSVDGKVKKMILIGVDAPIIAAAVGGLTEIEMAADMIDAVNKAARSAVSGDVVLLSPACASFDMFDNYAHRGNVFVETVKRLVTHEH